MFIYPQLIVFATAASFILTRMLWFDYSEPRLTAPILSGLAMIFLGSSGLWKWANISYRRFFYAMTSVGIWSISAAFSDVYAIDNVLWADLEQFASIFIPPLILLLFANLPFRKDITSRHLKIFALGSFATVLLLSAYCPRCFSPYRIRLDDGSIQLLSDPFLYNIIIFPYFIIFFSLAIYYLTKNLRSTSGRIRAQFIATIIGIILGIFGAILSNLLGRVLDYYTFLWAGPIFALIPGVSILYLLLESEATQLLE